MCGTIEFALGLSDKFNCALVGSFYYQIFKHLMRALELADVSTTYVSNRKIFDALKFTDKVSVSHNEKQNNIDVPYYAHEPVKRNDDTQDFCFTLSLQIISVINVVQVSAN